ncbi:hypothetical protein BT67DRAFT_208436 [Trichocladium antarcticum]|uniref:C2H2-type domain-containing protein n=1 Tax=Trichocladium antarcticum TaxID=1450529 RepID=A0AAN6ZAX7_9PEZI|nr:hypothetical protein BT67DRAFT_208436 [Trichocladium antarcticum]
MEALSNEPGHQDWPSWDDNISGGDFIYRSPEEVATSNSSTLSESGLDLVNIDFLDYFINPDAPKLPFSSVPDSSSPISSGDITWTPFSEVSSSFHASNMPCLSPDLLLSQSPPAHANTLRNSTIGMPELAPQAPIIPGAHEQSPPQTTTTTTQAARRRKNTPFLPARLARRITLPVRCPLCGKGHDYQAALTRHIQAHHRAEAAALGVPVTTHPCAWCAASFGRSDHLKRHLTRKHQRVPTGKTKGRRG